ncbi:hypothetical protein BHE74_00022443 [Ensete ventricosum]|nr:hypothetical protein GW17_00026792 [Ensete ventricosum]RWW69921.1 hypothetical protein BHE74_00022443 [Ensete ventricosum]RZR91277.1 hypothetical protein BHM03_00019361 [Ensete ventricosum]
MSRFQPLIYSSPLPSLLLVLLSLVFFFFHSYLPIQVSLREKEERQRRWNLLFYIFYILVLIFLIFMIRSFSFTYRSSNFITKSYNTQK